MTDNKCASCNRTFASQHGLKVHMGSCRKKSGSNHTQPPITTPTVINLEVQADLPPYQKADMIPKRDIYGLDGPTFASHLDDAYNQIIKWRKNLFKLPSGKASKLYISELATWLQHFNKNSDLHSIAMKVFHILPALFLQKPSKSSKAKEHLKKLEERLAKWHRGEIQDLLIESKHIQDQLGSGNQRPAEDTARIFARLLLQ